MPWLRTRTADAVARDRVCDRVADQRHMLQATGVGVRNGPVDDREQDRDDGRSRERKQGAAHRVRS